MPEHLGAFGVKLLRREYPIAGDLMRRFGTTMFEVEDLHYDLKVR